MSEDWSDPNIRAFFEELDRRVEGDKGTPLESRVFLTLARPALVDLATRDPDGFLATCERFFQERGRERG